VTSAFPGPGMPAGAGGPGHGRPARCPCLASWPALLRRLCI